jgi:hypothetical protein
MSTEGPLLELRLAKNCENTVVNLVPPEQRASLQLSEHMMYQFTVITAGGYLLQV